MRERPTHSNDPLLKEHTKTTKLLSRLAKDGGKEKALNVLVKCKPCDQCE